MTCGYRDCTNQAREGKTFCSYGHGQEEYAARKAERMIFSLDEISEMHFTRSGGYVNRRLEMGVWVAEHVLVMESVTGTRIPPGASVHHRNGIRDDNDPANLELWLSAHPSGQRVKCPKCNWPLVTY